MKSTNTSEQEKNPGRFYGLFQSKLRNSSPFDLCTRSETNSSKLSAFLAPLRMKKILIFLIIILISNSIIAENEAPFKLTPLKESIFITTGIGLNLLSLNLESSNDETIHANEDNISDLDKLWYEKDLNNEYVTLSNIFFGAEMLLPFTFMIFEDKNDFFTIGVMYAETLLLSNGIKETIKSSVRKERPYTYNTNKSYDDDMIRSFPSGHTSLAFSSAMFTSYVFSEMYPESEYKYLIYLSSFGLATATAASRIAAGKHFISDVLTGAVLGSAIGFIVPFSHKTNSKIKVSMGLNEIGVSYTLLF